MRASGGRQCGRSARQGLLEERVPSGSLGTGRPVSLWLEPRSVLAAAGEVDQSRSHHGPGHTAQG